MTHISTMATASSSLALALLFASLLASMVCGESIIPMMERFQAWQATYNRTYATPEEFQRRFEVYSENLEFIEASNNLETSYELGENHLTDLTYEEFQDMYLMKLGEVASDPAPEAMGQLDTMNASTSSVRYLSNADDEEAPNSVDPAPEAMGQLGEVPSAPAPEAMEQLGTKDAGTSSGGYLNNTDKVPRSVDWRKRGAVTPVKNQRHCGACRGAGWAFAAVASIEGAHKIKTCRLVSLSEQEILDCDRGGYNHGCRGGHHDYAMAWVMHNGGLTTRSDYPYVGRQCQCFRSKLRHHAATIRGIQAVPRNNEGALERAVAGRPVAVSIKASRAFQHYKRGVFRGPCSTRLNHAVTVVGYGVTCGQKYWIVKNSWGKTWGEKGYVRMERRVRARHGVCGIAMEPYYPVM